MRDYAGGGGMSGGKYGDTGSSYHSNDRDSGGGHFSTDQCAATAQHNPGPFSNPAWTRSRAYANLFPNDNGGSQRSHSCSYTISNTKLQSTYRDKYEVDPSTMS
jgi:hypothetical protein